MTSSKLGFVSAIALVAAVVTTPARAGSTTCDSPYSSADSVNGQVGSICAGADIDVVVTSQTWSHFFNGPTGASLGKAADFPTSGPALSLLSAVQCIDGTVRANVQSSPAGDLVQALAGCDKGVAAVFGRSEAVMAD